MTKNCNKNIKLSEVILSVRKKKVPRLVHSTIFKCGPKLFKVLEKVCNFGLTKNLIFATYFLMFECYIFKFYFKTKRTFYQFILINLTLRMRKQVSIFIY